MNLYTIFQQCYHNNYFSRLSLIISQCYIQSSSVFFFYRDISNVTYRTMFSHFLIAVLIIRRMCFCIVDKSPIFRTQAQCKYRRVSSSKGVNDRNQPARNLVQVRPNGRNRYLFGPSLACEPASRIMSALLVC